MAFTHRKADTSKSKASKNKASKSKTEYIKGTLDSKNAASLARSITVQLAEDTNPKSKRVAYGSLVIAGCFVFTSAYIKEKTAISSATRTTRTVKMSTTI